MANYQPITYSAHAQKNWRRYSSYIFAAQDSLAPLVHQELSRACMYLPIAFVQQKNEAGDTQFSPVAVQSLSQGTNVFVAPDGRWVGAYIPATYRSYPFALASTSDGQQVLCIDSDSGLVVSSMSAEGQDAQPFFEADGKTPSASIKEVMAFLQQVQANRVYTQRGCAVLQELGLFTPWPLTVKSSGGEQVLGGLFRVDETKLNELGGADLERLQRSGATSMAYCQLLSMQNVQSLGRLVHAREQAVQAAQAKQQSLPTTSKGDLDLEFLHRSDTLNFG